MNKNELVHVHALLTRVAEEYVEQGVATRADFTAYRALGTTPIALRQSRTAHATATRVLARTLAQLSTARPESETDDLETTLAIDIPAGSTASLQTTKRDPT
jgi:hypothetical protein